MRTAVALGLIALLTLPLAAANLSQYNTNSTRCMLAGQDTFLDLCSSQQSGNYYIVCPGGVCTLDLEHHARSRGPWPGGWFVFSWIEFQVDGETFTGLLCTSHRAPAQNANCDRENPPMVINLNVVPDSECDITLRITTELEDEFHQFGTTTVHERAGCRTTDGTVYWI